LEDFSFQRLSDFYGIDGMLILDIEKFKNIKKEGIEEK
jgi:hypothetical protein